MNANFVYQGLDYATGCEVYARWLTVQNISRQIGIVSRLAIPIGWDEEPVMGEEEFEELRAAALAILTRCESTRNQCYIDAVASKVAELIGEMIWVPPQQ